MCALPPLRRRERHAARRSEVVGTFDIEGDPQVAEQGSGLLEVRRSLLLMRLCMGECGHVQRGACDFRPPCVAVKVWRASWRCCAASARAPLARAIRPRAR